MNAIDVNNLTKIYRLYNKPKDRLREIISLKRKKYHHAFHALRDISFKVEKGQTVGIIGQNGSGKSTLLKIICGVLQPSSGNVMVNGRVSSLLELGAGFNPDFTGRENVYMNGALMGLTREEMKRRFSEIEAFADIGEYIDQPVKSYSNGMYVRLAFSAAVHIDPEILIVDEAMAIGDMYFQAKCMIRMKKMIDRGVTMIFVSHDMGAIRSLCQRCVYLENGKLVNYGETSNVVGHYISKTHLQMNQDLKIQFKNIDSDLEHTIRKTAEDKPYSSRIVDVCVSTVEEERYAEGATRYGDGGARILDAKLLNSKRQPTDQIDLRENFFIQFSVRFEKSFPTIAVGYAITDLRGLKLVGTVTTFEKVQLPSVKDGETYVFEIRSTNKLTYGVYTITISVELPVVEGKHHIFLDVLENAVVFKSNFPPNPRDWFPAMVLVPVTFEYIKVIG
jgi:lipopolysaccharide transport system ATP-binding protein